MSQKREVIDLILAFLIIIFFSFGVSSIGLETQGVYYQAFNLNNFGYLQVFIISLAILFICTSLFQVAIPKAIRSVIVFKININIGWIIIIVYMLTNQKLYNDNFISYYPAAYKFIFLLGFIGILYLSIDSILKALAYKKLANLNKHKLN